jgi:hypothetical protein
MRKKKLLIFLGVAVVLFLLLGLFGNVISAAVIVLLGDSMDRHSQRLMGSHGIDCGRVKVRGEPKTATDCALKAQSEGKPFRVRYDIQGYDSAVAGGIVRTPSGELYALSFVGNPSGSGGTSLLGQRVSKSPCPQPTHLWVNPEGRINCFQQQLSYPKDIMSPNLEPY